MIRAVLAGVFLTGCRGISSGTFVGNPDMTARFVNDDTALAVSGQLLASEIRLESCPEGDTPLGAHQFRFEGELSFDALQFPVGDYCRMYINAVRFEVTFDRPAASTVTAGRDNFDFSFPVDLRAGQNEHFVMSLGGEDLLAMLADLAAPDQTVLDASDADFLDVLQSALSDGTTLEESETPPTRPDGPLAGRLNYEGYDTSPSGTPMRDTDCLSDTTEVLAVPIPPAAMWTLDLGDTEVGWCEGLVRYGVVGTEIIAVQQDYSDLSTYEVSYDSWGTGCEGLHCNAVIGADGQPRNRACTVLASCDESTGDAIVTGFFW